MLSAVSLALVLCLPGEALSSGLQLVGDLAYVADGPDGLEIIRFRKEDARKSP
jgi:hypothetical protein